MDRPRNDPREPQQSILGEPPMALNSRMMGPPVFQDRPNEEDYMLASQIQQMTGIQNIDDIAQAMSIMKRMDPEHLQFLGSLDPTVIQTLVSGGPAALSLQGPVMDQLNHLINSGMIDTGALQLLMSMPSVLGQDVFAGGDMRPQQPPPRPLISRRMDGPPGGRRGPGNKPPPRRFQGNKGKKQPASKSQGNKGNKRGK
jgi:hypothetical protein